MLGLAALPASVQFVAFLFMPESPRWLVSNGDEAQARIVLQKLRGMADIEEELKSIKESCEAAEHEMEARNHAPVLLQMLITPPVRRALFIGCSLQAIQQLTGINTVMYYSATIIKMAGVRSDVTAIWLSAVTAFVNFLFTFVGLYLVERVGRRTLLLASLLGAVISLAFLAIGFHVVSIKSPHITTFEPSNAGTKCNSYTSCGTCMIDLYCGYCYEDSSLGPVNGSCLMTEFDDPTLANVGRCNNTQLPRGLVWAYDFCPTQYAWLCVVGLILYLVFFAPGMGPMPWTINSEIYPLWARSTGCAVATCVNWIFNLLVSMTFLTLTEAITRYGAFWLYAGLASSGLIFFGLFLPETKGKSLEEVEGLFAKPWCGQQGKQVPLADKTVQYVHIRGLNRDGRQDEDLESPE